MTKKVPLGSYIKKLFVPLLKEHGYEFIGKRGAVSWAFVKKETFNKVILFQKSNIVKNAFTVHLETEGMPVNSSVNLIVFAKRREYEYWWEYEEHTLQEAMDEVKRLLIDYGIPYLEAEAKPNLEPPSHFNEELVQNAKSLAKEYHNKIKFSGDYSNYVVQMKEELIKRIKSSHEPDWEFILQASVALGEYVIDNYGGNWGFSIWEPGRAVVTNVKGNKMVGLPPLQLVSYFWGKQDVYGYDLYEEYRDFIIAVSGGLSNTDFK